MSNETVTLPDTGISAVVVETSGEWVKLRYEDGQVGTWPIREFSELEHLWPTVEEEESETLDPDMPLNVAEEIVAALPTAYPWIFERMGFGDIV